MFLKTLVLASALMTLCQAVHIGHHQLHHSQGHGTSSQSVSIEHGIPSHDYDHHDEHSHENAYPKYEYRYSVSDDVTRDQKSHSETRDGDTVRGEYSLLQPDGSTRTVRYTADKHNGFQAEVSTTGGNQHYDHHHNHLDQFDNLNLHHFH